MKKIPLCHKCRDCISKPLEGHLGAFEIVGCKELTDEQWEDGNRGDGGPIYQHNCPLMAEALTEEQREISGGNRWRVAVELTFDVLPVDLKVKHEGDALGDFQSRAFARIRPELDKLLKEGKFAHYHILEQIRGCTEFD